MKTELVGKTGREILLFDSYLLRPITLTTNIFVDFNLITSAKSDHKLVFQPDVNQLELC